MVSLLREPVSVSSTAPFQLIMLQAPTAQRAHKDHVATRPPSGLRDLPGWKGRSIYRT